MALSTQVKELVLAWSTEFIYSYEGCVYTGGGQLVAEGWETTSHLIASNF